MVNNLGGISDLELGSIVGESKNYLESKKIGVAKILAGTYMTSLNMPGFSLTLLLLPRSDTSSSILSPFEILEAIEEKTPGSKWVGGVEKASATSIVSSLKGAVSAAVNAATGATAATADGEAKTGVSLNGTTFDSSA